VFGRAGYFMQLLRCIVEKGVQSLCWGLIILFKYKKDEQELE